MKIILFKTIRKRVRIYTRYLMRME